MVAFEILGVVLLFAIECGVFFQKGSGRRKKDVIADLSDPSILPSLATPLAAGKGKLARTALIPHSLRESFVNRLLIFSIILIVIFFGLINFLFDRFLSKAVVEILTDLNSPLLVTLAGALSFQVIINRRLTLGLIL